LEGVDATLPLGVILRARVEVGKKTCEEKDRRTTELSLGFLMDEGFLYR